MAIYRPQRPILLDSSLPGDHVPDKTTSGRRGGAAARDTVARLRAKVQQDPAASAIYQDTVTRAMLLAAGPARRRRERLSQQAVAEAMGTTQSAVSDLESGRVEPQLRTLQRYARALGQRLDVSLVDDDLPIFHQGAASELWFELEKASLSALLTTLAVDGGGNGGRRTLEGLAESLYLSAPIVDPILETLQARGWVSSAGTGSERVYSLINEAAFVIGISLGRHRIVGVLVDLKGEVLQKIVRPSRQVARQDVIDDTVAVVEELFHGRGRQNVLGVGVILAGVVNSESGMVRFARHLQSEYDDWTDVALEAALQEGIQRRLADNTVLVAVENDANALAVREYLRRGDHSVVVLLLSGAGIGAGFVFGGQVSHGAHFAAGEGGHMIIDPAGPPCRAGLDHAGCLDTLSSAQAILDALNIPVGSTTSEIEYGLAKVNELVEREDRRAIEVLRDAGLYLGRFLASTVVLLDPARAVLYAHRPLADAIRYASAAAFQEGVRSGFNVATSGRSRVSDPVRLEWHCLEETTGGVAASAVAMRQFLARPVHWAPSVLGTGQNVGVPT